MNTYELSSRWFDFAFENPDKIKPIHSAIYFFAIENCKRLGWKEKFGLPTSLTMEAIGVKKFSTYKLAFDELIEWGFITIIKKSVNQYTANIITINEKKSAMPKKDKALGKALAEHGTEHGVKHGIKHGIKQGQSTVQSKGSIDIIDNTIIDNTKINNTNTAPLDFWNKSFNDFSIFRKQMGKKMAEVSRQAWIDKLKKLSSENEIKAKEIINQSIENGWQGIFEIKQSINNQNHIENADGKRPSTPEQLAKRLADFVEFNNQRKSQL